MCVGERDKASFDSDINVFKRYIWNRNSDRVFERDTEIVNIDKGDT